MGRNIINIAIPSLLLLLAIFWSMFGNNILREGYGLERDREIIIPPITSTHADFSSLDDLKGHTTYLTFGFSHCADNCPFTLAQYIKLVELLPDNARLVFVSIDNARDDMTHLTQYLHQINPAIIGWRMADNDLQQFAAQFQTHIQLNQYGEPSHDSDIHVIDMAGRWVKTYPYLHLNEDAVLTDYLALQQQLAYAL